jgi:hypothetical protein
MTGLSELERDVSIKLQNAREPAAVEGLRQVLNFIIRLGEIEREWLVERYNQSMGGRNANL